MKVAAFLTAQCPHKCEFCGVKEGLSDYKEATVSQWIEAIDAIKPSFFILFGGEPQFYQEWDAIVDYLKLKGIPYTLFTTTVIVPGEPLTVSIDSPDAGRSKFGLRALEQCKDVVVNTQIHSENVDFVLKFLDELSSPWLIDLNHGGLRKDGKPYILRSTNLDQVIVNEDDLNRIYDFLVNNRRDWSMESQEAYKVLLENYPNGWKCKPEEYIGYLTLAPDTSLMACVDLPLIHYAGPDKKLWAKDWPTNKEEYIKARAYTRDQYCVGCCWRHEITALMYPEKDWSTEGMLKDKK